MRTIITIPDKYKQGLDRISKRKKLPRTELIRRAIANYIQSQTTAEEDVFGLWKKRKINALQYQTSLRDEWQE